MSERDYLYRAKNAYGEMVTDRISASSADNALQKLKQAGFGEIELHTDDVFSREGLDPKLAAKVRRAVDPDIIVRLRNATAAQAIWLSIVNAYRKSAVLLAILMGFFVFRRFGHIPLGWLDYGSLLLVAWPVLAVLVLPKPGIVYRQIQKAGIEARYQDVLTLCAQFEPAARRMGAPGLLELAVWRAKATAKLRGMESALAIMEDVRSTPALSLAAFQARLATLYESDQDFEAARRFLEEAVRLEPNQPAGWLGLADLLATRFEGTSEARAALDRLCQFTLASETRKGLSYIQGTIALNERRFDDARRWLESAHTEFTTRARAHPVAVSLLRQTEALLTVACARAGDRPAAQRYFAACEGFLRLHNDEDLLRRCETALA